MDSLETLPRGPAARARGRLAEVLGEQLSAALADPEVSEIAVNPDGRVFLTRVGRSVREESGYFGAGEAAALLRAVASLNHTELNPAAPLLDAVLPGTGARFSGIGSPLTAGTGFCIRKNLTREVTLGQLRISGVISAGQEAALVGILSEERTLLVCGPTGCGKTTLLSALLRQLCDMSPERRVISIEDTPELRLPFADSLSMVAGDGADMHRLLRSALRLTPDTIVVGEVRGREALDMLDAFSTGHRGGMTTMHAGSAAEALRRLTLLASRHEHPPRCIEPLVADAIGYVAVLRSSPSRQLAALAEVRGYDRSEDTFIIKETI